MTPEHIQQRRAACAEGMKYEVISTDGHLEFYETKDEATDAAYRMHDAAFEQRLAAGRSPKDLSVKVNRFYEK